MTFSRLVLFTGSLFLLLGLAACHEKDTKTAAADNSSQAQASTPLANDDEKFSYALGMMIGERILKQYGAVDYDILLEGMKAKHLDQETLLDLDQAGEAVMKHQQAMTDAQNAEIIATGNAFLEENAKADGVTVTASGLQYKVITPADGDKPSATDSVTVHYRGVLLDGTEFDSSYSRGEPATFKLNQVIPGWTEGVQLMSVGSKYKFAIPHQLAYGERGAGGPIGPYETLIFEVELISINQ